MSETIGAVRLDLGEATSARMVAVRSQLEHLFPPAPFPLRVGYGPVEPGWREVEAWRVIPNRTAPRFLVPVDPASASRLVVSHNSLRSPRVAATRRLASAVIGPLAVLQGDRSILRVSVPAEVADDAVDEAVVTRHLRRRVPGAVATAISLRDFHPRAKPTVQIVDGDGHVLAFAKVASDPATGERVLAEADLLTRIGTPLSVAPTTRSTIRLPAVRDRGRCGPFAFSVVEPLPQTVRGAQVADEDRVLRGLAAFSGALSASTAGSPARSDRAPLGDTALWRDVTGRVTAGRVARGARPDLVAGLDALVAAATARDGGTEVQVGCYHGDWVPWNMAWEPDSDGAGSTGDGDLLWAWDLEYGSVQGPRGLDALRWTFQVEHVLRHSSFTVAVAAMSAQAPRVLPMLGVEPRLAPALVRLHVIDTIATALGLLACGRGLPAGLDPDAADVMHALTM